MTILVSLLFLFGVTSPAWLLIGMSVLLARRWRGVWRLAALLPLALPLVGGVRIARDLRYNATSHNLWPVELAIISVAAMGGLAVIFIIYTLQHASRHARDGISPTPPNER